jgi:ABC-type branched-subunit amino acid transport system ATPase component/branched-subunit amino acid ABC-type transport system permease component
MDKLFSNLIIGLISGGVYAVLGSGIVLTYQTTGIFNLGYGAIAFAAAYLYFELHSGLNWPVVPAAVVTLLVAGPLLGLVLDRFIFRRLTGASDASKMMASIGVLVAVPALAQYIVEMAISVGHANIPDGEMVYSIPSVGPTPAKIWHLSGHITFSSDQLIVVIVALLAGSLLWFTLRRTRLGLQMRAVVNRPELAVTRGVDRGRTSAAAWTMGTTMAALAGIVGAPIFGGLSAGTYLLIMLAAVAGAVIGGFRSVPLAALGGFLLGAVQSLVAGYATFAQSIPGFSNAVPFAVLLIGLAVFGRNRARIAGAAAELATVAAGEHPAGPWWRRHRAMIAAGVVFLVWLFAVADPYWVGLATDGLAVSLVLLSFTLMTGTGGIVSLAQAAFVTSSGLMAGLLIDQYHMPFLIGMLGGVAFAVAIGIVVALPALRLGGLALALATLALGFLGDNVLFQWSWLAGPQAQGWALARPAIGSLHFTSNKTYSIALLVVIALVIAVITNLQRSPSGRAISAVRSSQVAAVTNGISAVRTKLKLFTVSAAIAGVGGVLLVTYDGSASSSTYSTPVGLVWLATVVLWGVRRPAGAILAGITSSLLGGLMSSGFHFGFLSWSGTTSPYVPSILFGLGAITMSQSPDGILAMTGHRRRGREPRRKPASVTADATSQFTAGIPVAPEVPVAPGAGHQGLRVSNVSAGYGQTQVLFDVGFDVAPGSIAALVGANGAGKSTLCGVLSGLVPAARGTVAVDGQSVSGLAAHRRTSHLMLAPESRGIFPGLSVADNLAVALPDVRDRQLVYERFPILRERRAVPAGSLSGGEQQMLTMAPLMVRPPQVLIADEPTLGLAPRIAGEILEMFQELRDRGVTLLIVEERAKSLLEIADSVILLELGRVVWAGARQDLDQERLAAVYLGQASIPSGNEIRSN